jgi:hypothetical protein
MNALHLLSLSNTPPSTYTSPNMTTQHYHNIAKKHTNNILSSQEKNSLSPFPYTNNDHNAEQVQNNKEREERIEQLPSIDDCSLLIQPDACFDFEKKAQGSNKTTDIISSSNTIDDDENEFPSVAMNTKNEEDNNGTPVEFITKEVHVLMTPTRTPTVSPSTPIILIAEAHTLPALPLLPRRRGWGGIHDGKRVRFLESYDSSLSSLPYLPSEFADGSVFLTSIRNKKTFLSSSLMNRKTTKEEYLPIPSRIGLLPRNRKRQRIFEQQKFLKERTTILR